MSLALDRLYHLHWVMPELARSAQPYMGFYRAFLRPHGFKSIINLRGPNPDFGWWHQEKRAAESLGIAHFDVKLSSKYLPARSGMAELFNAFDRAGTPLLLKCSGGQDRTSLAAALYLLHRQGPGALAEAMGQFAFWPYLHRPKPHQLWLREFPGYALREAGGLTLGDWARTRYDPQGFARFLDDKGMGTSFRAFQAEAPG